MKNGYSRELCYWQFPINLWLKYLRYSWFNLGGICEWIPRTIDSPKTWHFPHKKIHYKSTQSERGDITKQKNSPKKHSLFAICSAWKKPINFFKWRHWLIQIGVSFLYGLRHSPNRSGFKYVFSVWNIDFLGISWGCFLVMGLIFFLGFLEPIW